MPEVTIRTFSARTGAHSHRVGEVLQVQEGAYQAPYWYTVIPTETGWSLEAVARYYRGSAWVANPRPVDALDAGQARELALDLARELLAAACHDEACDALDRWRVRNSEEGLGWGICI